MSAHSGALPSACTLGPTDGAQRLEEWRRICVDFGVGHEVVAGRLTLGLRDAPGLGADLERLVAAERLCCGFLGWELSHAPGEWHVLVSGSDEQLQALPFAITATAGSDQSA